MSFFWKHKLLSLLIAALLYYWFTNPADRFGIARQGIVVYNRIPVTLFDLYVSPGGTITPLDNLREQSCVNHWLNTHAAKKPVGERDITLLVGTGFGPGNSFTLDRKTVSTLRNLRLSIRQLPSAEAVKVYNEMRSKDMPVAILLKVK